MKPITAQPLSLIVLFKIKSRSVDDKDSFSFRQLFMLRSRPLLRCILQHLIDDTLHLVFLDILPLAKALFAFSMGLIKHPCTSMLTNGHLIVKSEIWNIVG